MFDCEPYPMEFREKFGLGKLHFWLGSAPPGLALIRPPPSLPAHVPIDVLFCLGTAPCPLSVVFSCRLLLNCTSSFHGRFGSAYSCKLGGKKSILAKK